jgi:hypothetical protein
MVGEVWQDTQDGIDETQSHGHQQQKVLSRDRSNFDEFIEPIGLWACCPVASYRHRMCFDLSGAG